MFNFPVGQPTKTSMHFISSGFIFVSPYRYSNRPASHFDRTIQYTPLLYNNFPMELPFELCQLQSSWSVLHLLNFIDIQYQDSLFEGLFFPPLHSNKQPCLSLLPMSLSCFFQPLTATICTAQMSALICRGGCEEQGWDGSRVQCASASDPETVLKAYG